ncbi:biotin/lipoyl-binding protein, partial [Roseomonas mucosa]
MKVSWKPVLGLAAVVAVVAGGYVAWRLHGREPALPAYVVSTNGRIEAEQFDIASKIAGRVVEVTVEEGQMVAPGAVIARLDDSTLQAQLRAAEAQVAEAQQAIATAEAEQARAASSRRLAQTELT